jgi:tetratricopeptide (TPR) repeat protein
MAAAVRSERGALGSPARGRRAAGPAIVILIAVLALGRFVLAGGNGAAGEDDRPRALDPATLEARVATDPDDGAAWQALAVHYTAVASGSGDRAKVERAEHAVAEANRLRPGELTTYRVTAALQLTLHQFADAHATGLAARAAHPDSPDTLNILVDSSIELGRYADAELYLEILVDRRPDAAALARVSYLREIHGDTAGARLAMQQAETAASGNADEGATIAVLVGDLALADGDATTALAAFDRAERLSPGRTLTLLGRARAFVALDRDGEALALLTEAAPRIPEPAIWTLLGDVQSAAGLEAEAAETYAHARSLIERHGASGEDNALEAALFEADHGDPLAAVTFAQRAYDIRPTVFTADALGWALVRAGRPAEAAPFMAEALRLGTDAAELHVHAAAAARAGGDRSLAASQLETAFARAPWPSLHLRAEAARLAAELSVAVPEAWRP